MLPLRSDKNEHLYVCVENMEMNIHTRQTDGKPVFYT